MVIVGRLRTEDMISPLLSTYYSLITAESLMLTRRSPVVRTNPVTGWKSLFGAGHQVYAGWIDNVTETESEVIKAYCKYFLQKPSTN